MLDHQQGSKLLTRARGFSLIELIIGMVILGVLMAIAIPGFSEWLRNARVRGAADAVQNGLQLARAEAVRRNTQVGFYLVSTIDNNCARSTAGPHWIVGLDTPDGRCASAPSETVAPRIIQMRTMGDGSSTTTLAAGQHSFVFNGFGRLTAVPAADADGVVGGIKLSSADGLTCRTDSPAGPVRCLRVIVSVGGQIRMCDPSLPSGDTQACS